MCYSEYLLDILKAKRYLFDDIVDSLDLLLILIIQYPRPQFLHIHVRF